MYSHPVHALIVFFCLHAVLMRHGRSLVIKVRLLSYGDTLARFLRLPKTNSLENLEKSHTSPLLVFSIACLVTAMPTL